MYSYPSTSCDNRFSWFMRNEFLFFMYTRSPLGRRSLFLLLIPHSKYLLFNELSILISIHMLLMHNDVWVYVCSRNQTLWYSCVRWVRTLAIFYGLIVRMIGVRRLCKMGNIVMSIVSKAIIVDILNIKWIFSHHFLLLFSKSIRCASITMLVGCSIIWLVITHYNIITKKLTLRFTSLMLRLINAHILSNLVI